jgi:hypothetical protein
MYNKIVIELESELNPHRETMGQSAKFNLRGSKIVELLHDRLSFFTQLLILA